MGSSKNVQSGKQKEAKALLILLGIREPSLPFRDQSIKIYFNAVAIVSINFWNSSAV